MSDPIDSFFASAGGDARTKAMLDAMVQSERDRLTRQRLGQTETKEVPGATGQTTFYVESTFTPTYFGSTLAGATTYTTQYGVYFRVGNALFVSLRVAWSATTATGNGQVGGLPFASGAASNAQLSVLSANHPYTNAGLRAFIGNGIQYLQLFDQVAGAFAAAAVDAAADLIITGWYPLT